MEAWREYFTQKFGVRWTEGSADTMIDVHVRQVGTPPELMIDASPDYPGNFFCVVLDDAEFGSVVGSTVSFRRLDFLYRCDRYRSDVLEPRSRQASDEYHAMVDRAEARFAHDDE